VIIVLATRGAVWESEDDPVALAHHARMKQQFANGEHLCSGVRTDGSGGVLVSYAKSEEELRKLLDDEFHHLGYMTYEFIEFDLINVDARSSLAQDGDGDKSAAGATE
jgi:uncharacterized protein YciI